VSDAHIFGSTIEGLETVSHLITRYAIFESVHLQRKTAAATEIEPVLTKMYAEMLVFLARSKKYFQTPTASEWYTAISFKHAEAKPSSTNAKKRHYCL
jgi:hypothetical protein